MRCGHCSLWGKHRGARLCHLPVPWKTPEFPSGLGTGVQIPSLGSSECVAAATALPLCSVLSQGRVNGKLPSGVNITVNHGLHFLPLTAMRRGISPLNSGSLSVEFTAVFPGSTQADVKALCRLGILWIVPTRLWGSCGFSPLFIQSHPIV